MHKQRKRELQKHAIFEDPKAPEKQTTRKFISNGVCTNGLRKLGQIYFFF